MPRRPRLLSPARAAALRPLLDALDAELDRTARIGADPVELPRRYPDRADAEVAGLVAASAAYGRADVFKPVVERLLAAMGPSPAAFVRAHARAPEPLRFEGASYRFNRPVDFAALAAGIGHVLERHGGLGLRFAALLAEEGGGERGAPSTSALRSALARFAAELRDAPPAVALLRRRGRRGLLHLLPDAAGPGASKRWNLYLRWMVRGPDSVDLGLWPGVPTAALVVPLDTHVHRVARALGLTARVDASWRTAEEITASLRRIDPVDPVRYDFALCHLGMSGACPARRDPGRCGRCPLHGECLAGRSAISRALTAAARGAGSATSRTVTRA